MTNKSPNTIIKKITIKNLTEYIDLIEGISSRNPDKIILYRGQSQDFDLLPSIARKNHIEDTTEKEREILDEFKRRSRLKISPDLIDDWDWLIYAQHYGLKTRLLDWTSNPLIGLWFCCCDKPDWNKDGTVYILIVMPNILLDRRKQKSPFLRNSTKVYKPYLNNERIVAQSGWFTAHGFSPKANMFVSLNKNFLLKRHLTKIIIPNSVKEMLLEKLNILGVNYEKLFPDIGGICRQINYDSKL